MNMVALSLTVWLAVSHAFDVASSVFYEDISESFNTTIARVSLDQKSFPHNEFHKCSITGKCNFVIKDTHNGLFTQCSSQTDFPPNKTGLRIWKKMIPAVQNCQHGYKLGFMQDGPFLIDIPTVGFSKVRCDMTTQPGGWIVFQRRVDATGDFDRNWKEYRDGFGDMNGNFWLGLEKVHQLAGPGKGAKLRVDLKHIDFPTLGKYAEYSLFEISSEAGRYILKVGGYFGTAGDSLSGGNNWAFSTKDSDNDDYPPAGCAVFTRGAWWHARCSESNLNNVFPYPGSTRDETFMSWYHFSESYGGIVFSEMKIKV